MRCDSWSFLRNTRRFMTFYVGRLTRVGVVPWSSGWNHVTCLAAAWLLIVTFLVGCSTERIGKIIISFSFRFAKKPITKK